MEISKNPKIPTSSWIGLKEKDLISQYFVSRYGKNPSTMEMEEVAANLTGCLEEMLKLGYKSSHKLEVGSVGGGTTSACYGVSGTSFEAKNRRLHAKN